MREIFLSIASFAAAAMLTALAVLVASKSPFWWWLLWSGAAVLALCAVALLIDIVRRPRRARLDILFGQGEPFVHKTFYANSPENQMLYVAVIPVATTPEPAKNCAGFLNAVFKLGPDNKTWLPTSFATSQALEWGAMGWMKLDIHQDTRQPLNVLTVFSGDPRLHPVVAKPLNKDASLFNNRADVFRFDIAVTSENAAAAKRSLRVALGDGWDDIQVSLI